MDEERSLGRTGSNGCPPASRYPPVLAQPAAGAGVLPVRLVSRPLCVLLFYGFDAAWIVQCAGRAAVLAVVEGRNYRTTRHPRFCVVRRRSFDFTPTTSSFRLVIFFFFAVLLRFCGAPPPPTPPGMWCWSRRIRTATSHLSLPGYRCAMRPYAMPRERCRMARQVSRKSGELYGF